MVKLGSVTMSPTHKRYSREYKLQVVRGVQVTGVGACDIWRVDEV